MKMLPGTLWLLCLTAASTRAETTTNELFTSSISSLTTVLTSDFSGSQYTYVSYTGQSTIASSSVSSILNSSSTTSSSTESQITRSASSISLTVIGGSATSNSNATGSSTTSAAAASNTIPCNGYPEFCNRQYSNITNVCAHNSAFVVPSNAGSNQALSVTDQLNDGVRMIQGETHYVNDTIWNCHTTCNLLNAGMWQSELEVVLNWVRAHPYDVVTWLVVNSDLVSVDKYVPAIENSGIREFLYEPDYVPQRRDQWPTLAEMILSGKRVVMFMDYNANQTAVPYILNEFSHMWETPFSPTNQGFPCTQQRPPDLSEEDARDKYMYLANHNLNTAVDVSAILGSGGGGEAILIPNTAAINRTNGEYDQFGQLGAMSLNCTSDWGRPPNFLLVDYYNYGDPGPGSVFDVAARANGVTYNKKCCGLAQSAASTLRSGVAILIAALAFAIILAW